MDEIRRLALDHAVNISHMFTSASEILQAAKAFEAYLKGAVDAAE